MSKAERDSVAARRQAEAAWNSKKQQAAAAVRVKVRQMDTVKTARLRELRLAKEAADKDAAAVGAPKLKTEPAKM